MKRTQSGIIFKHPPSRDVHRPDWFMSISKRANQKSLVVKGVARIHVKGDIFIFNFWSFIRSHTVGRTQMVLGMDAEKIPA